MYDASVYMYTSWEKSYDGFALWVGWEFFLKLSPAKATYGLLFTSRVNAQAAATRAQRTGLLYLRPIKVPDSRLNNTTDLHDENRKHVRNKVNWAIAFPWDLLCWLWVSNSIFMWLLLGRLHYLPKLNSLKIFFSFFGFKFIVINLEHP